MTKPFNTLSSESMCCSTALLWSTANTTIYSAILSTIFSIFKPKWKVFIGMAVGGLRPQVSISEAPPSGYGRGLCSNRRLRCANMGLSFKMVLPTLPCQRGHCDVDETLWPDRTRRTEILDLQWGNYFISVQIYFNFLLLPSSTFTVTCTGKTIF